MSDKRTEIVTADVYSASPVFERVLGNKAGPVFVAEAGFAIQILTANDYALGIATTNRQSVIDAVSNVAAIGITLNPARKQAYLVPRDGKICLDISYRGLMDMALEDGCVQWVQCHTVHEQDAFELSGIDKAPKHNRNPFAKDRGGIVGVYCVAKTQHGDYITHAMPIDDVHAIRNRSSAWNAWVNKKKKCPWVTDEVEMIKKTCIKQGSKYWPRGRGTKLDAAIEYLNTSGDEGMMREEEPSGVHIPASIACSDALAAADADAQQRLRDAASKISKAANDAEMLSEYEAAHDNDNEIKLALWALLPSNVRSAIKRAGQHQRLAEAVE